MRYSAVIVAVSAFVGVVSAQNQTFNTPIPCCSVPANTVADSDRTSWCDANMHTCTELCGGQGKIASNGNTCTETDLKFSCKCSNGSDITSTLSQYQQSVPGLMCRFWYGACVNASGTDAQAQFQCQNALDSCGNKTTDASKSSSASGTASVASGSSPTSGSAASPSQSKAAAANLAFYATPALAGGLLAVFGLAL